MKKKPDKPKFSRRQLVLGGALIGCLLILGYWLHTYSQSPRWVANLAVAALKRGDANALVGLASEKERQVLHLTPQTVDACLREVGWNEVADRMRVDVLSPRPYYGDVLMYTVEFSGGTPNGKKRRNDFYIYREPSGKWRLGLSMLLYELPPMCKDVPNNYSKLWDVMAQRSGIVGCTIPGGPTRFAADGSHTNDIRLTVPDS
jgi:hypothetical protein